MIKLNNKGQSLVLFVLLLPIFLIIMTLVFDIGNAICLKLDLDNVNHMAISYGLDNIEEEGIEDTIVDLVKANYDEVEVNILIENDSIILTLGKKSSSFMGHILDIDGFEIVSKYKGSMEEEKRIERVK